MAQKDKGQGLSNSFDNVPSAALSRRRALLYIRPLIDDLTIFYRDDIHNAGAVYNAFLTVVRFNTVHNVVGAAYMGGYHCRGGCTVLFCDKVFRAD